MIPHYNMTGEIAEGLQEVIDRRREPLFSLLPPILLQVTSLQNHTKNGLLAGAGLKAARHL